MEGQQQVGVVTLAAAELQQSLAGALGAALDALMTHLAKEACQRCQSALDSCHTLTKYKPSDFTSSDALWAVRTVLRSTCSITGALSLSLP